MILRIRRRPRTGPRAGISLIEVSIALLISATFLLVSASAFSASLSAAGRAERVTDGALFLQTTMESIGAQGYANLLALDGNRIFEETDWDDSRFVVDVNAFQADLDLVQLTAVLIDTRTGLAMGRASTLRVDR